MAESFEYGLIGEKLEHSISPKIHALFADYDYRLIPLSPEELPAFLTERRFRGMNVTIPYKKMVIPFCSQLSPRAKSIGSVNTLIVKPDGTLFGDNTDYFGFQALVKSTGISFSGKKVMILGNGGVSLTIEAVAKDEGAVEVRRVPRIALSQYKTAGKTEDAQVLVNATPVGMFPNIEDKIADLENFPACQAAIDMIYNPLRTGFVLDAMTAGIPTAGGLRMLVYQAYQAAELFTGMRIPESICLDGMKQITREQQNIVLIGMPGCGKTTIGKELASRLNRPFIDTDQMVETAAGKPIAQIFSESGESTFRKFESEAILSCAKQTGCVIAVGGGSTMNEKNSQFLRMNGWLVFLKRPLGDLEMANGRPLSQTMEQLEALYEKRLPNYQRICDQTVDNSRGQSETVSRIIREWEK